MRGVGVGLRTPHIPEFAAGRAPVGWVEALADNYFNAGIAAHRALEAVRANYPVALHSVGMSLGSTDPINKGYFKNLKELAARYEPAWLSDHLCFTHAGDVQFHDLLPLPCTEEAVRHAAGRIREAQDLLGQRILIENVSTYLRYRDSSMNEIEFLRACADEADCHVLLDVNNLYVSAMNQREDPAAFMRAVPFERVRQIHLGGYQEKPDFLLDAHNNPVSAPVWDLFEQLAARLPHAPVLIEWDNDIPPLPKLLEQARTAAEIVARAQVA